MASLDTFLLSCIAPGIPDVYQVESGFRYYPYQIINVILRWEAGGEGLVQILREVQGVKEWGASPEGLGLDHPAHTGFEYRLSQKNPYLDITYDRHFSANGYYKDGDTNLTYLVLWSKTRTAVTGQILHVGGS